jgi:hypothetical protein
MGKFSARWGKGSIDVTKGNDTEGVYINGVNTREYSGL